MSNNKSRLKKIENGIIYDIESEDDAFNILESAINGKLKDVDTSSIRFSGWPKLNIYLPHTPLEGSITPTMMEAFIELQTAIYRTHSLVSYGSADLRGFTKPEREQLEFRVKVSEGSSDYLAELAKSSQAIVSSLVGKMTPTDVVISVVSLALIIGGSVAWNAWLKAKISIRKEELDLEKSKSKDQTSIEQLRTQLIERESTLNHDTRRYEMLLRATQRLPILEDVEHIADSSRSSLVRAVADEAGGQIQGIDLPSDFAHGITSTRRQQSHPTEFVGIYKVTRVDTTSPDGFKVTLSNIENDEEITASLQDALVSEDHKSIIRDAEWRKTPVRVKISARKLRNRMIDAVILDVTQGANPQNSKK